MKPFTSYFALPKVALTNSSFGPNAEIILSAQSTSTDSVCPHCNTLCKKIHGYRKIKIREPDMIKKKVFLDLKKTRYWCDNCNRAHLEFISGISYRARTSQRMRAWVCDVALRSSSLALASRSCRVSVAFVFRYFHQMLSVKLREFANPWPKFIGIDEHAFKRNRLTKDVEFVTVFVDHVNKRLRCIALGRDKLSLIDAVKNIDGAERVAAVSIDLSIVYREFAKEIFTKARIVADKFHVMRLFGRLISKERIAATGDKRQTELCQLLKRSQKSHSKNSRERLTQLLTPHKMLHQAYLFKVKMYWLYRQPNKAKAHKHFIELTDGLARVSNNSFQQLRQTLLNWKNEILNYFDFKITNARVEAFNNRCKVVKRKGYGYRNFSNYARRCLGETLLKA